MADKDRTIRVPIHVGNKIRKMARARNELVQESGREPATDEIAGRLGWTADEFTDVKSAMPDATSLNQTLTQEGDGSELGEPIENETTREVAGAVIGGKQVRRLQQEGERILRTWVKLPTKHAP